MHACFLIGLPILVEVLGTLLHAVVRDMLHMQPGGKAFRESFAMAHAYPGLVMEDFERCNPPFCNVCLTSGTIAKKTCQAAVLRSQASQAGDGAGSFDMHFIQTMLVMLGGGKTHEGTIDKSTTHTNSCINCIGAYNILM